MIDKEKVKRQLELCNKLENIDKTDLIDMATKKKLSDKDYEIKVLQEALELACEILCGLTVCDKAEFDKAKKDNYDYFIEQAKEMLKNE